MSNNIEITPELIDKVIGVGESPVAIPIFPNDLIDNYYAEKSENKDGK